MYKLKHVHYEKTKDESYAVSIFVSGISKNYQITVKKDFGYFLLCFEGVEVNIGKANAEGYVKNAAHKFTFKSSGNSIIDIILLNDLATFAAEKVKFKL